MVALFCSGRIEEAQVRVAKLIEALPDVSDLHMLQARNLAWLGRMDEAETAMERAFEIGLNSDEALAWSIDVCLMQGEARNALRAARRLAAQNRASGWLVVLCLRALGEDEEAALAAEEYSLEKPPQELGLQQAWLHAVLGKRDQARALLEQVERPWYGYEALLRAQVHAVLGDVEEAARWIGVAAEKGFPLPDGASMHPDLAAVVNGRGVAGASDR